MPNSINQHEREAIGRRLAVLSQPCQEVLLVAAAIGTEFDVETVSKVCRRRVDQVRQALEYDAGAGLVSAVSRASGIYRFSEPAVRDLVYQEIPRARRPWLRRQIAEVPKSPPPRREP